MSPGGSCNSALGLVTAASQRQGKRQSQEDRTIVEVDLMAALMGKVKMSVRMTTGIRL